MTIEIEAAVSSSDLLVVGITEDQDTIANLTEIIPLFFDEDGVLIPVTHGASSAVSGSLNLRKLQIVGLNFQTRKFVMMQLTVDKSTPDVNYRIVKRIDNMSQKDARDLEPVTHMYEYRKRGLNSVRFSNLLITSPGETIRVGFDCDHDKVMPENCVITSQANPTFVGTATGMTLVKVGHDAAVPKFNLIIDDAALEQTAVIEQEITTSFGSTIKLFGEVKVEPLA